MDNDIKKALKDVRIAFRLLEQYQSSVLDIVRYILDKTPYIDIWGKPRNFVDTNKSQFKTKQCEDSYATLNVLESLPQFFLYGNYFEYYFGEKFIKNMTVGMSIIQISDSGYVQATKKPTNNPENLPIHADASNSYFIFTIGSEIWLGREASKEGWAEDDYTLYLQNIISAPKDLDIIKGIDEKHWCITKRYPMEQFSSQEKTDEVLADFGKIVEKETGIKIFQDME